MHKNIFTTTLWLHYTFEGASSVAALASGDYA